MLLRAGCVPRGDGLRDEIRLRLRTDGMQGTPRKAPVARVERITLRGRTFYALVLSERVVDALDLAPGDEFLVEGLEEIPWTVEFKYAVDAVAKSLRISRDQFVGAHPIGVLNTPEGERAFWQARTEMPDLPVPACRNGIVVKTGSMDFVYLNPEVWESGRNVVTTSVHMILHILYPGASETELRDREESVLRTLGAASGERVPSR